VVSDKDPGVYREILEQHGVAAGRFLMVGNSLRSDILPVLELGGWAVYVPHSLTWTHEQVAADCLPGERCFEIGGLEELEEAVSRMEEQ
jgi:putative hydrolase of the HAD superfamily